MQGFQKQACHAVGPAVVQPRVMEWSSCNRSSSLEGHLKGTALITLAPPHHLWRLKASRSVVEVFNCRVGYVSVVTAVADAGAAAALPGRPPIYPRQFNQGKAPVLTSHRGTVLVPGHRSAVDCAAAVAMLLLLCLVAHPSTPGSLTRARLRYLQAIGGQCWYLGITVFIASCCCRCCCCSAWSPAHLPQAV
jgi:hypothetical protein